MIQITPHMKILLAVEPVDFRKGIDGLAMLCRTVLQSDPFSGCVFVFLNKGRTSIKILMYDGQGYWMSFRCCYGMAVQMWLPCGKKLQFSLAFGKQMRYTLLPWKNILSNTGVRVQHHLMLNLLII